MTGLPTGFVDLDEKTSGLQKGDLIIVAARPAMGKTSLCLNIAQNATARTGEVVGIFVHHEMVELLGGAGGADDPLRERVVTAANHSKDTQRKANDLVGKLYFDALFGRDVALPLAERPRRRGTIMGFTSSKVHVSLDEPPLDVKLYVRDVGRARGGAWLVVADDGASLRDRADGALVARLGDEATVFTEGRDARQDRWILQLEGKASPA